VKMGGRQWYLQTTRPRRLGAAREADARRIPRPEPGAADALRTGARACPPDRQRHLRARPPRVEQGRRPPGERGDGRSGGGMSLRVSTTIILIALLAPAAAGACPTAGAG